MPNFQGYLLRKALSHENTPSRAAATGRYFMKITVSSSTLYYVGHKMYAVCSVHSVRPKGRGV